MMIPSLLLVTSSLIVDAIALAPSVVCQRAGAVCRLHSLTLKPGMADTYNVSISPKGGAAWCKGTLRHLADNEWRLCAPGSNGNTLPDVVSLGSPEAVYAAAVAPHADAEVSEDIQRAAPFWPEQLVRKLEAYGLHGEGTIVFDTTSFLSLLTKSSMEHPVLFPRGAAKMGLDGLNRAEQVRKQVSE